VGRRPYDPDEVVALLLLALAVVVVAVALSR
jgi:hypothetical protein